jgi:hypothetical protein
MTGDYFDDSSPIESTGQIEEKSFSAITSAFLRN